jgi:hypothetical protein
MTALIVNDLRIFRGVLRLFFGGFKNFVKISEKHESYKWLSYKWL